MAEITERELSADIKGGKLKNIYLFHGEEGYLKRLFTDRIIKKAVTDFADFNLHRFDASAGMNDIAAAVDALPMMSERSCVVLRDYNFASASDGEHKQLVELLSKPNDMCVLIMLYDNLELPSRKTKKASEILDLINKNGCTVNFKRKTETELVDLVIRRATKAHVSMQPTTARYLISLCGVDIENLLTEVDKLCAYIGSGNATEQDIDAVVTRTVEASAFALANAVCSKRRDEAFKICTDLFDLKTEPVMLIGALSSVFVDIYRVKLAQSEGLRAESIADDFGYGKATFKLRNAASNGRFMTQSDAYEALEVLRDADIALKSTRANGRVVVETALVRLLRITAGEGNA